MSRSSLEAAMIRPFASRQEPTQAGGAPEVGFARGSRRRARQVVGRGREAKGNSVASQRELEFAHSAGTGGPLPRGLRPSGNPLPHPSKRIPHTSQVPQIRHHACSCSKDRTHQIPGRRAPTRKVAPTEAGSHRPARCATGRAAPSARSGARTRGGPPEGDFRETDHATPQSAPARGPTGVATPSSHPSASSDASARSAERSQAPNSASAATRWAKFGFIKRSGFPAGVPDSLPD